jgi:outer membrane protein assembly factor BamB
MTPTRNSADYLFAICLACLCVLLGGCGDSSPSLRQNEDVTLRPAVKWSVDLGEGINSNVAVASGSVFITTGQQVYALDTATGKTVWRTAPPGYALSSPAVADGLVYFGAKGFSDQITRTVKVTAYALDARTGKTEWQQVLSNDRSQDSSNPVTAGGLVYFGTGWSDYSCCEKRGNGGHIVALDGKSGQVVWQMETKGNFGSGGMPASTLEVANGMLYFGAGNEGPGMGEKAIHALDGRTGKEEWKVTSDTNFPLVGPDGMLYVVLGREVVSIDGKTGQERWRWTLDSSKELLSNPAFVGDTLYLAGNATRELCLQEPCPPPKSYVDTLFALDPATGKEKWKQDIAGGYNAIEDVVPFKQYLCYEFADFTEKSRQWYLEAVSRDDGKFKWQVGIGASSFGLPAVEGGNMYLGVSTGTVYALQLP